MGRFSFDQKLQFKWAQNSYQMENRSPELEEKSSIRFFAWNFRLNGGEVRIGFSGNSPDTFPQHLSPF